MPELEGADGVISGAANMSSAPAAGVVLAALRIAWVSGLQMHVKDHRHAWWTLQVSHVLCGHPIMHIMSHKTAEVRLPCIPAWDFP